MHFYSKNRYEYVFIAKSFPMHFYSKNRYQYVFIVKIISNAFL